MSTWLKRRIVRWLMPEIRYEVFRYVRSAQGVHEASSFPTDAMEAVRLRR